MLSYRIGYSRKCSFGDWWRPCVQLRRGLTSSRVRANTYWSKGDKRSKYGSTDTLQHLHTVYSCHKRLKYCELIFPLGFPCQSFFVASRSFPCNCPLHFPIFTPGSGIHVFSGGPAVPLGAGHILPPLWQGVPFGIL